MNQMEDRINELKQSLTHLKSEYVSFESLYRYSRTFPRSADTYRLKYTLKILDKDIKNMTEELEELEKVYASMHMTW
jgi:hypothetical protein